MDRLRKIFNPDIIEKLKNIQQPSKALIFRLEVLDSCAPYPLDKFKANLHRYLVAQKSVWENYLDAADECGMFKGDKGRDTIARLRGTCDAGFRSAMAECEVCWFIYRRMGYKVAPNAPGRNRRNLDMRTIYNNIDIGVEVKAPYRTIPNPPLDSIPVFSYGDDSEKISECIKTANKQFKDDCPNILFIIPALRENMFNHRHDLMKAIYGESKIFVNRKTKECSPIEFKFFPEGKFFNTETPRGKKLKTDGFPANRRVSAILCIEEKFEEKFPKPDERFFLLPTKILRQIFPQWERDFENHYSSKNKKWIEHQVLVLHNPYAYYPLPERMWDEFPQFLPINDEMQWTDGYEIDI